MSNSKKHVAVLLFVLVLVELAQSTYASEDIALRPAVRPSSLNDSIAVEAEETSVCWLLADRTIQCWNGSGRAIDEGWGNLYSDLNAAFGGNIQSFSTGPAYGCAINSTGNLVCQGSANMDPPDPIGPYRSVTVGSTDACAIKSNNDLVCWGDNPLLHNIPAEAQQAKQVAVSGDIDHPLACAINLSDKLACWGTNIQRQLDIPVDLQTVTDVHTRFGETCVIQSNGHIRCWGTNAALDALADDTYTGMGFGFELLCTTNTSNELYCRKYNDIESVLERPFADVRALSVNGGRGCAISRTDGWICFVDSPLTTNTHFGRTNTPFPERPLTVEKLVYGPRAVELQWTMQSYYGQADLWEIYRDGELIGTESARWGVRSYFDSSATHGFEHTYALAKELNGFASEPVILPGLVLDATDNPISVTQDTINWPENGWYSVQSAVDQSIVCEGGIACTVEPGIYTVINHSANIRYDNIAVGVEPVPELGGPITVSGSTLSWPDDGWYRVQSISDDSTVCEGGTSCTVVPGIYVVINLTTDQRFGSIVINATSSDELPTGSAPFAPTNSRLEIYGPTVAEIFWDKANGVASTEVKRDSVLIGLSPGNSFIDGTRLVGVPHRYELVAIDANGSRSDSVSIGIVEDQILEFEAYAGDEDKTLAISGTSAVVAVSASSGSRAFNILEYANSGQWELVHTVATARNQWDSPVAIENDIILAGTVRFAEELADYENDLLFNNHDFYIFERDSNGYWNEYEILDFSDVLIPNLRNSDISVALDGDTAMLGGRNDAVYVFSHTPDGQWLETQKLTTADGKSIGYTVSIDGDTAAIGSREAEAVYVFTRDENGKWFERQKLNPSQGPDRNFDAVVDAETLVIGGFTDWQDGKYSTKHYVYSLDGDGQWSQSQVIVVNSYQTSVALDGGTLVIGAPYENGLAERAGSVLVFEQAASGEWIETSELFAGSKAREFGSAVALDGRTVLTKGQTGEFFRKSAAYFFSLPSSQ